MIVIYNSPMCEWLWQICVENWLFEPWTLVASTVGSEPQCFGGQQWTETLQSKSLFIFQLLKLTKRLLSSFHFLHYRGSSIIIFFIIHDFRGEHYLQWNMAHRLTPKGSRTGASFLILQDMYSLLWLLYQKAGKGEKLLPGWIFYTCFFWLDFTSHNIILLCQGQSLVQTYFCGVKHLAVQHSNVINSLEETVHKSWHHESENQENWEQQKYSWMRQQKGIKPVYIYWYRLYRPSDNHFRVSSRYF